MTLSGFAFEREEVEILDAEMSERLCQPLVMQPTGIRACSG